jgi:aryl-alcohol dehydrogenase-like predicted oxidoreductase
VASQVHYHLLERGQELEMLPFCRAQGVGVIPFFPLAGGFLTGKYKRGEPAPAGSRGESAKYVQQYMTPANYTLLERLTEWAAQFGRTPGEAAQAWLLAHPEVSSVISGATRAEQMQENAKAGDWNLTPEEFQQINAMLQ